MCSQSRRVLLLLLLLRRRRACRHSSTPRTVWVHSFFRRRQQQDEFHNLVQELRFSDPEKLFRYLRMSKHTFDNLLEKVSPLLVRRHYGSTIRPGISPAERIALTLRFLATGNSQVSLSFGFRMGRSTECSIFKVCEAIWNVLVKDYVKAPASAHEWEGISQQFERIWNFPQCIGAIDGKHVVVQQTCSQQFAKGGSTTDI